MALSSGNRRAECRRDPSDLILHLDKFTADLWQSDRASLCDLSRRGNRVSCIKTHACRDSAFDAGFISLQQLKSLFHYASSFSIYIA